MNRRQLLIGLVVLAVIAIGVIGLDEKEVTAGVTALTHLLSDNQAIVRYQGALALGRLGVDAKPAKAAQVSADGQASLAGPAAPAAG